MKSEGHFDVKQISLKKDSQTEREKREFLAYRFYRDYGISYLGCMPLHPDAESVALNMFAIPQRDRTRLSFIKEHALSGDLLPGKPGRRKDGGKGFRGD